MTTYYELLKHLKIVFEEDENVNLITTIDNPQIIDNFKKNLYPLVHINVISSPYVESTSITRYLVEVHVLDIRDITKEEVNDKFWLNDNLHDNLNHTRAILKKASNKLIKDHLNTDITLFDSSDAEPVVYAFGNLLDGWLQTWTIDLPDEYTTVC